MARLIGEIPEDCPCLESRATACIHCGAATFADLGSGSGSEPEKSCARCESEATVRRQIVDASTLGLVFEDELLCGYHEDEAKAHEDEDIEDEPRPGGFKVTVKYIDVDEESEHPYGMLRLGEHGPHLRGLGGGLTEPPL